MLHYLFNLPASFVLLMALLLPLMGSALVGPYMIRVLSALKAGQPIRQAKTGVLAPAHESKAGTPTMGGIMIMGLLLFFTLLFGDLSHPAVLCFLLVASVTTLLGFLDDRAKILKRSSDGVSGKVKLIVQGGAALLGVLYFYTQSPQAGHVIIPFFEVVDIGWLMIPLSVLVIVGSSNAVNLTDGLDGLAGGCTLIAALCFAFISWDMSLGSIMLAMAMCCAGFLWFNCYPAKVFMGDTGSLALGAALGSVAVCTGNQLSLLIVGAVFVAEALSVMLQVFWFKYTKKKYGQGRRLLRMAPLHHHFEKGGWVETQITVRFWIMALICAFVGFSGALSVYLKNIISSAGL